MVMIYDTIEMTGGYTNYIMNVNHVIMQSCGKKVILCIQYSIPSSLSLFLTCRIHTCLIVNCNCWSQTHQLQKGIVVGAKNITECHSKHHARHLLNLDPQCLVITHPWAVAAEQNQCMYSWMFVTGDLSSSQLLVFFVQHSTFNTIAAPRCLLPSNVRNGHSCFLKEYSISLIFFDNHPSLLDQFGYYTYPYRVHQMACYK